MATEAFYDKQCTCPHCECNFQTKKIRRGSQSFVKRDADFCTYFKDPLNNPILYTVNVCPTCGFAYSDGFQPKLFPAAKKLIKENITSKWTAKDFGNTRSFLESIVSYKLAIYTSILINEAHSVTAGLYLRLAWLYRFQNNWEEEKRFLFLAVEEYEQSYIHSDYTVGDKEMSEVKILYLIGELYRRVEMYDKSVQYFSRAVALKDETIEKGIIQFARDQWSLAREENARKRAEEAQLKSNA